METMSVRYKIALAFGLIMVPITLGVSGYMVIEGAGFLDALFMTITTVATVGYGEVFPLSRAGRIFTIILIVGNLGIFAYALTLISRFLFESNFFLQLRIKRMKTKIAKLSGHVIICGFGRNGHAACEMLKVNGLNYVIIESKKELLEQLVVQPGTFFLNEDATRDETLLDAGIERARGLITTLPNDADNVFVTLTAKGLNPELTIISRASDNSSFSKLKRAGATNVIMPDRIGGAHMASLILRPDVKEFVDILSGQAGADVQIEEFASNRLMEKLMGRNVQSLEIRKKSGANVIGLKSKDGNYIINPDISSPLDPDSKLIILATAPQMKALKELLS